jgi:hypothetical protein
LFGEMFFNISAGGKDLRRRALPKIAQETDRMPDTLFGAPDLAADEAVRRRFFGDE